MEKNLFSHRDTEDTEVFTEKKKYFGVSSPALRDKLCILCLCGYFMLDVPTDGLSYFFMMNQTSAKLPFNWVMAAFRI